eukprot:364792-Chlamydomonas_euryale.AAC.2
MHACKRLAASQAAGPCMHARALVFGCQPGSRLGMDALPAPRIGMSNTKIAPVGCTCMGSLFGSRRVNAASKARHASSKFVNSATT